MLRCGKNRIFKISRVNSKEGKWILGSEGVKEKKRWGGVAASMMLPAGRAGVGHSWVSSWSGWCRALMGEQLVGLVSGTHDDSCQLCAKRTSVKPKASALVREATFFFGSFFFIHVPYLYAREKSRFFSI